MTTPLWVAHRARGKASPDSPGAALRRLPEREPGKKWQSHAVEISQHFERSKRPPMDGQQTACEDFRKARRVGSSLIEVPCKRPEAKRPEVERHKQSGQIELSDYSSAGRSS
jgi:hypothetical protein